MHTTLTPLHPSAAADSALEPPSYTRSPGSPDPTFHFRLFLLRDSTAHQKCSADAHEAHYRRGLGHWAGQTFLRGQSAALHTRIIELRRQRAGEQHDLAPPGVRTGVIGDHG